MLLVFYLSSPWSTPLATFADTPRAGWCPVSGYEEPCLVISLVVLFPSIRVCPGTYSNWILLCSANFTMDWWQSQSNLEFHLEARKVLDGCLSVGKKIDVPTCVNLFCILHYTCLNGVYFGLEFHGMEPKIVPVPPSQAPSIHPAPVTFLVLDLVAYQTTTLCCLDWTNSDIHTSQGTWPCMACDVHNSEASCLSPSYRWAHVSYPESVWCVLWLSPAVSLQYCIYRI